MDTAQQRAPSTGGISTPPQVGPGSGQTTSSTPAGLPRLRKAAEGVWVGGTPEPDVGFDSLKALGIRTILCVDGAPPDAEAARRRGIRVVHVPSGYDGFTPAQKAALTRAAIELPQPMYVHCHHGRHRGPAAAAVCGIAAGSLTREHARTLLSEAGTDPKYRGLWSAIDEFTPPPRSDWPALAEQVAPPPRVERMLALDERLAVLKQYAVRDREASRSPDATAEAPPRDSEDARHAALLLWEECREWRREEQAADEEFQTFADALEAAATALLAAAKEDASPGRLAAPLEAVAQRCTSCHERFRDN